MYHSIEELVAKVKVLGDKATLLHNSQYRLSDSEIQYMIDDIQSLCRDICCDSGDNRNP